MKLAGGRPDGRQTPSQAAGGTKRPLRPPAAGYLRLFLQALKELPAKLGLGRYLCYGRPQASQAGCRDSTRFDDGSPAKLDGTMGQCMWCWNAHYFTTWTEGNRRIQTVTFRLSKGKNSIYVPAGGISWIDAGVMDRTNKNCVRQIHRSPLSWRQRQRAVIITRWRPTPRRNDAGNARHGIKYNGFRNNGPQARRGLELTGLVARAVVGIPFRDNHGYAQFAGPLSTRNFDAKRPRPGRLWAGATICRTGTRITVIIRHSTSVGLKWATVWTCGLLRDERRRRGVYQCKVPVFSAL